MPILDRSVIAGLPPFEGLQPDDLDRVLELARSSRYPRESVVFAQDAEATSFTGPLDANGTYSGDPEGSLRHDCRPIFTDYTLTAEGEGGRSTVQFSLLTRIP